MNLANQQNAQGLSGVDETAERTVIVGQDELFMGHKSWMCEGELKVETMPKEILPPLYELLLP
jgi:hypothetical protein